MKLVVAKYSHKLILLLGYIVWPLAGWHLLGPLGAAAAFVLAYLLDRFYPRTMTCLTWNQIELGIRNFLDSGVLGARLYVVFGRRRVFLQRIELRQQPTLTLQYNRKDWSGLIDEKVENAFLGKWVASIMPERLWRLRKYVSLDIAPEDGTVENSLAVLRELGELSELGAEALHLRADYAHLSTRALFETRGKGVDPIN